MIGRSIIKWAAAVSLAILTALPSAAQKFVWGADGGVFIDNAEGSSDVTPQMTLAGAWIAPRLGVEIADSAHRAKHRFMAGFDFTQQFGMPAFGQAPDVHIFYNYRGARGADHSIGLMPRAQMHGDYSRAMFSDSTLYFNHTVQGAVLSWRGAKIGGEVFFDWFALDRASNTEAFMVGGSFDARFWDMLTLDVNGYYAHNKICNEVAFLNDNAVYGALIGVDVARFLPLDALSLKVGVLGSWNRNRISASNSGTGSAGLGLNARFKVAYKGFAVEDEFFCGNPLSVMWGSRYYDSEMMNRADVSWGYLLKIKEICSLDFRVSLILYSTPTGSDFSQMARVVFRLGDR